jgi:hypothetical protein
MSKLIMMVGFLSIVLLLLFSRYDRGTGLITKTLRTPTAPKQPEMPKFNIT